LRREPAHLGLAPVALSGFAVGLLQVSLFHLIVPFVGADVYAFLMTTGLFFAGFSLTALFGERLAGALAWIEIASGLFFLALAAAEWLCVAQIYDFGAGFAGRRSVGIGIFLLAGLLQGPILAAYPRRVSERFLRVYELESACVCVGALLAAGYFAAASPVLGVAHGGAFALAAGALLLTPKLRSLYQPAQVPAVDARRVDAAPQALLFAAGLVCGCLQYALQVMGQMWLDERWLIPSLVIAACVAAISVASRSSRRLSPTSVTWHLPFFLAPAAALLLLALSVFPFRGWGWGADVMPSVRLAAISFLAFLLPASVLPRVVEDRRQRYGASLSVNAVGFLLGIWLTTRIDVPVQRALPWMILASAAFALAFWALRLPRRALLVPLLAAYPLAIGVAYSLHPEYGRGALGFPVYVHSWSRGLHTTFIGDHSFFENGSMRLMVPSEFEHLGGRLLDRLAPPGPGLVIGSGTGTSAGGLAVSGREVVASEVSRSVESFLASPYRERFLPYPADFELRMVDGLRAYSSREQWAGVLIAGIPDAANYSLGAFYSWPFVRSAAEKLGPDGVLGYLITGSQRDYIAPFLRLLEQHFRYFRYVAFLDSYGVLYCSNRPLAGREPAPARDPARLARFYDEVLHTTYGPEEIVQRVLAELTLDWERGRSIVSASETPRLAFEPWDFRAIIRNPPLPEFLSATPRLWFDLSTGSLRPSTRARSQTQRVYESVYHGEHRKRLETFESFRAMRSVRISEAADGEHAGKD
jgi:hypothetical protein